MKILVSNINQKTIERGTEIFWKNLSRELENHGASVKIFSSSKSHTQNKSLNIFCKILRRLYLDSYSLHVLIFTLINIKKIISFKPDIIIPTNGGWQVLILRLVRQIGFIGKSKIVIIGHSGIGHDDEFNLRFGGASLFVALTKEQETWARNINSKIKIEYISNGIDTKLFTFIGEKFDYNLEKPIFLTVASFEKYKNIEKTINAVSNLDKGSLIILGSGEEERNLKTLCDTKLKNRYYMGSVNHEDLPRYYRGADVFTLVSDLQEAFGLVYLEAMACGLPVVATDDEKRREIIGNAGLFVNIDDTEAYKTALMNAVVIDWGEKPRLQAEKFSWEKIGDKYYKTFKILTNTN